jgi:hypothetical protein
LPILMGFAGPNFCCDTSESLIWAVGWIPGPNFIQTNSLNGPFDAIPIQWKKGDTVGVACNLSTGSMLVSINGNFSNLNFSQPIRTGIRVGSCLFPIIGGGFRNQVKYNLGFDPVGRPFQFSPPDKSYLASLCYKTGTPLKKLVFDPYPILLKNPHFSIILVIYFFKLHKD